MKNITKFLMICIAAFFVSCDTDPILAPENYTTFEVATAVATLDVGSSVTGEVRVFTGGTSGASYDLIIDEATTIPVSSIDVPSSVVIPAGSNQTTIEYTITFTDEFDVTGGNLVLRLEDNAENLLGKSQVNIEVRVTCDTPAIIAFEFDGYASEITWEITDMEDNTIYSGGGYSDGLETFSRDACLNDGDYKFVVNDSYGDGLSFPNEGRASVSFDGIVLVEAVGDFGSQFVGEFTIQN